MRYSIPRHTPLLSAGFVPVDRRHKHIRLIMHKHGSTRLLIIHLYPSSINVILLVTTHQFTCAFRPESSKRNNLFLLYDINEISDGLPQMHTLDSLGRLTSVLEVYPQFHSTGRSDIGHEVPVHHVFDDSVTFGRV